MKRGREVTISRRWFIAGTLVGGTAIGLAVLTRPSVQKLVFDKLQTEPLPQRAKAEALANRRSIFWTAVETVVVFFANVFLGNLFDSAGVDHGGHAADGELYEEQLESAPISIYARDNFVMPIIEETMFRLLPSAFFSDDRKLHWGTGLASAAFFAGIHNVSKPEADKITLHFDSIPVEQFVLGCYCWWAQRRGGFLHSAGSHVLYNNLCEAYWHFYERKQLEKMQQKEKDQAPD